ncbi:MAG: hypothetical protein R3C03_04605 [Pirellulaceae bacterium]
MVEISLYHIENNFDEWYEIPEHLQELMSDFWNDIYSIKEARVVIWIMILATILAVSVYVIKWIRDMAIGGGRGDFRSSDSLSTFRELRDAGKINDEEFRRVRASVGTKQGTQAESDSEGIPTNQLDQQQKKILQDNESNTADESDSSVRFESIDESQES